MPGDFLDIVQELGTACTGWLADVIYQVCTFTLPLEGDFAGVLSNYVVCLYRACVFEIHVLRFAADVLNHARVTKAGAVSLR